MTILHPYQGLLFNIGCVHAHVRAAYPGAGGIATMFIDELTTVEKSFFVTHMFMYMKLFSLRPMHEGN